MRTRIVILIVLIAGVLVAATFLRSPRTAPSSAAGSPTGLPADLTVKQIMTGFVDPQADALWASVGTIVTKAGVEELAPKTDADWAELADHAERLGQAATLLETHPHPPNPLSGPPGSPGVHVVTGVVDPREWVSVARGLGAASAVALRAVRAKDPAALFDAGETLAQSCDACHHRFWDDVTENTAK